MMNDDPIIRWLQAVRNEYELACDENDYSYIEDYESAGYVLNRLMEIRREELGDD